jgi:hypothetical protein
LKTPEETLTSQAPTLDFSKRRELRKQMALSKASSAETPTEFQKSNNNTAAAASEREKLMILRTERLLYTRSASDRAQLNLPVP